MTGFIVTLLISMLPVVELRGGIPFGVTRYGMEWWQVFLAAVVGNLLPVPWILLFARVVLRRMKQWRATARFAGWLERHALARAAAVRRYEAVGLAVFVAIPLPGTGAWTGAVAAAMLGLRMKLALPAIAVGVVVAGIVVTVTTAGVVSVVSWF